MNLDLNIDPVSAWDFPAGQPFVIAGPCSAESERQVLETAQRLAQLPVHVLRAGVWKPRTRPSSFEGVGTIGLDWLRRAREITGLKIATEVANARHVDSVLNRDIDMVWVGARTTSNPFSVQDVADALRGVNVPVLVKNPISPDLDLWIGAIERLEKAGVRRLAAVHRGFHCLVKSKYRNRPNWEIPIELKRRIPDLPLLCDPSHICGSTELILPVCQKAMDLNFNGLMIESHIDPPRALSDANQQVTPERLGQLLQALVMRHGIDDDEADALLHGLRQRIDRSDRELLQILADRIQAIQDIGQLKKAHQITIFQPKRWDKIIKTRLEHGKQLGLSAVFVRDLLELLHREAIHIQTRILNAEKGTPLPDDRED